MDIDLAPGSYVVAVSGGVDSVVLLDLLWQKSRLEPGRGWSLTVAHFDHGIRGDAAEDRQFVQKLARGYELPFVYDEGRLGTGASEAAARRARYGFLNKVLRAAHGRAIITAHHQDDLLETAILNILRGTGRKGLSALDSRQSVIRPLLHIPKAALVGYARDRQLDWREDSTNLDEKYLRNYIRRRLMPRFDPASRERLLTLITRQRDINRELDGLLIDQLHLQSVAGTIDRQWFNRLPHGLAREVMATWLRAHGVRDFDRRMLERLVVNAKVAHPERAFPVTKTARLRVGRKNLALEHVER